MSDYFQSTNINASNFYKNGKPINLGGQGAQGATGAQGTTGTQGATGAQGAQGATSGGELPVGSIIMWYGTTIPQGWNICNGSNGTPDLRNRFVIGAGDTFPLDASGGNAQIQADNLPPHKHNNTLVDDGHFHEIAATLNTIGENDFANYKTKTQNNVDVQTDMIKMTSTTANITITNVNNETNYDDYYPPYYALYYIMFTGQ